MSRKRFRHGDCMTDTAPATKLGFYDRLKLATKHRLAEPILALLCFLEAMIIPVFPEIMLAPMIIADRMRAWRLARRWHR
ncbi:MAG: hypothetical protein EON93_26095, partial [Burkholderiales bacterium]